MDFKGLAGCIQSWVLLEIDIKGQILIDIEYLNTLCGVLGIVKNGSHGCFGFGSQAIQFSFKEH